MKSEVKLLYNIIIILLLYNIIQLDKKTIIVLKIYLFIILF